MLHREIWQSVGTVLRALKLALKQENPTSMHLSVCFSWKYKQIYFSSPVLEFLIQWTLLAGKHFSVFFLKFFTESCKRRIYTGNNIVYIQWFTVNSCFVWSLITISSNPYQITSTIHFIGKPHQSAKVILEILLNKSNYTKKHRC